MAKVVIDRLKKQFGTAVAVSDFSLNIEDGELVAFLGPSGCGKTTTLRMIAGFIMPTEGSIFIGDEDVTSLPVHKRNTGMVFQRYALFPHMTVGQNVSFGLEMHKVPPVERDKRIREALDMVRMSEYKDRYPRQLSGGQQQRVAIARALAIQPKVFLLDEPLSNLDAKLRVDVREEIRALQRELGLTTVFVTHDQEEALAISDRMAIMHDGRVQQVGSPNTLYERPANLFVADFLGKMNFFLGKRVSDAVFLAKDGSDLTVQGLTDSTCRVGVRPERVVLLANAQTQNSLPCTVESAVYLGPVIELKVRLESSEVLAVQMPNTIASAAHPIKPGEKAFACFNPEDCAVFSE